MTNLTEPFLIKHVLSVGPQLTPDHCLLSNTRSACHTVKGLKRHGKQRSRLLPRYAQTAVVKWSVANNLIGCLVAYIITI